MIERKILAEKMREFEIEEVITKKTKGVGHSHTKVQRTPLGEKIVIHASRPGLVVGRKGANIIKMTKTLKKRFKLNNPQIEISEVNKPNLDANIVSERIATSLERFGASRFKGIGHKTMADVMKEGALGVEIIIGGRGVPGERAKSWRFYSGYLKKCGDLAVTGVKKAYTTANLKTGSIGVKVRIMPPNLKLPDNIVTLEEKEEIERKKNEEIKKKEDEKMSEAKDSEHDHTQKSKMSDESPIPDKAKIAAEEKSKEENKEQEKVSEKKDGEEQENK